MNASTSALVAPPARRRRRWWWRRARPLHAATGLHTAPPPPPPNFVPPPPAPLPPAAPAPAIETVVDLVEATAVAVVPEAAADPSSPTFPAPPPEVVDVTRHHDLRGALQHLERRVSDVQGTVVASRDGLALASTFHGSDGNRVAAMAASVVGLAEEILADPDGGASTTIVRGAAGCLVVHPAGPDAVLAARTGPDPNVGLVHLELPAIVASLTRSFDRC